MIDFIKYSKIKDNYLICYFGPSIEYLHQLRILKSVLEKEFKGLKIFISCKDNNYNEFINYNFFIRESDIRGMNFNFAHIRELRFNNKTHPIEDFINECDIKDITVDTIESKEKTTKCVILSKATYPTKSLNQNQVELLKKIGLNEGYEIFLDQNIENAGLVMGVESDLLLKSAEVGVETRLYPTGLGTSLYKRMFPNMKILSLK